jgi:hypothetical protein
MYGYTGDMGKSWSEMTPAERLADRIAKNREIDQRVSQKALSDPKKKTAETGTRSKAARNVLDEFQQIKRTQGMDAAADFVRRGKA